MNRLRGLTLALAAVLLLPLAVAAQGEQTSATREGSKFIGLAMTKQEQAERAEQYRQALAHLRPAMETDTENARVFFLAGQALAGIGEMAAADSAFDRAIALYPDYTEDVEMERRDAWIMAFQAGANAMEAGQSQEAIELLNEAEMIYQGRPEAHLYLGVLYANEVEDYELAERSFRTALEATRGPLLETLTPEQQEDWIGLRESLRFNIERTLMTRGVRSFSEQNFTGAIQNFADLTEWNPYSRDAWFNYGQSLLSEASAQQATLETLEGEAAEQKRQELIAMYDELQTVTEKAIELDPHSEILLFMLANTHTVRGQLRQSEEATAEGQRLAYEVVQKHDALDFMIDNVSLTRGEGVIQITGEFKNRKLAEGTPVQLRFTLVDLDGETIGEQTITVNAPAADGAVSFEGSVNAEGDIAGWRYTVVR